MSKSHVSVGHYVCPVCGIEHGECVLMDKKLRDTLERTTVLGQELCKQDKALFEQGYIALVGIDLEKSKPEQNVMYRTGQIIHIRKEAMAELFPDHYKEGVPLMYADDEVITKLKESSEAEEE